MSVAELKTDLIRFIIETDNQTLLEKVASYFKNLQDEHDWWDDLTEEQKRFVKESTAQIDSGETTPNDDVRKEINELLGKN